MSTKLAKLSACALILLSTGLASCSNSNIVDLNDGDGNKIGEVNCKEDKLKVFALQKEWQGFGAKANTWYTSEEIGKAILPKTNILLAGLVSYGVSTGIEEACTAAGKRTSN